MAPERRDTGARPARPEVAPEVVVAPAPRWRVIIHNDPITTFDFVIGVLGRVFALTLQRAEQVAQEAHSQGCAFVVALPFEQAEFKVERAHGMARAARYPLKFTYERE